MEVEDGIAREGSFDGSGGLLDRKLALRGLFLMSLALACLFLIRQEGLSARESFTAPFYLALWVLFLFGLGYILLSVLASGRSTSQS